MSIKAKVIEFLRSTLGDNGTSWLHAARYYWLLRTKEANEVDMLLVPHLMRDGDVVVDVGANSADWTWRLSKQVGSSGRVFAFEANPYYAEVTRKVITLLRLKNVDFFPFGLSDKAGHASLQIRTPDNLRVVGTGHIVEASDASNQQDQQTVQIRLMPLDEVAEIKPFVDLVRLIKCDVEGHELNVFKGAANILERSRPIVITEVGHTEYQIDNEQQIISFFDELDYDCYVVGSDNRSLLPAQSDDSYPDGTRPNRIMIPREKSLVLTKQ